MLFPIALFTKHIISYGLRYTEMLEDKTIIMYKCVYTGKYITKYITCETMTNKIILAVINLSYFALTGLNLVFLFVPDVFWSCYFLMLLQDFIPTHKQNNCQ